MGLCNKNFLQLPVIIKTIILFSYGYEPLYSFYPRIGGRIRSHLLFGNNKLMPFSWQDAYGVESACQMQMPIFALPENKLP
jgi:hypothetical protein